jgi:NADP-dependent 3-hydroxy acid dehydrogenase YdfG
MDMKKVDGKVIIVTGASMGIGLATARLLAQNGAKVALAARSIDTLKKLEEEIPGSFAVQTDMTNKVKEHFGRIDVLVNNAGQGLYSAIEDVDIDAYRKIIDLNIIGPLVAMQSVIPIMKAQGEGHILNISSNVSKNYFPMLGAYASTKYALNCLSLTARAELEDSNIIVNVMHPGLTATDFGKNSHKTDIAAKSMEERFKNMPEADSAEYIAERILHAIESGRAEVMAHED